MFTLANTPAWLDLGVRILSIASHFHRYKNHWAWILKFCDYSMSSITWQPCILLRCWMTRLLSLEMPLVCQHHCSASVFAGSSKWKRDTPPGGVFKDSEDFIKFSKTKESLLKATIMTVTCHFECESAFNLCSSSNVWVYSLAVSSGLSCRRKYL